jgi:PAS domain S-box-containing protein
MFGLTAPALDIWNAVEIVMLGINMLMLFSSLLSKNQQLKVLNEANAESVLRTLVDGIPQLAWIAKADGWTFFFNRQWYEYTGMSFKELEGWGWQKIHDQDALPRITSQWLLSIQEKVPSDMEYRLRSSDGEYRWFLARVLPFFDSSGELIYWFGTCTDIDRKHKLYEESTKSLETLQKLQELTAKLSDDSISDVDMSVQEDDNSPD